MITIKNDSRKTLPEMKCKALEWCLIQEEDVQFLRDGFYHYIRFDSLPHIFNLFHKKKKK